ncbi:aldose 1-epimerase family protein [Actinomycetospora chibensis]|uniref:Aldose 1-epimerase family protein n=1 Tax=Actinomycetospora chibensis TaxID=663606 RepID=A0ABV9RK42_9PSEU|nr:aldose 1-epimerase family protein [Actinomycetospora chibensis]MDD7927027.1 aldose 1-epimerase family protein [Actinomycetospora chibensis]
MHPTGEQIDLVAGATHAVVTEVGGGLRALEVDGGARVEDFDADATPPMGAGMVLVPWPNRIAGAGYSWRGREYALEVTEPARGHAIHGFLRRRPWTIRDRAADAVTFAADVDPSWGWPGPLHVETTYAVDAAGLAVTHALTNTGDVDVPAGLGAHPYLRAGDAAPSDCTLTLAADRIVDVDDALIPTGVRPVTPEEDLRGGRRVADLTLDTCFGAAAGPGGILGVLTAPDGRATALWADPDVRWVQVFTPDDLAGRGRAVAVEPMTCPPDAAHSGTDLRIVAPGETWSFRWGVTARDAS